MNTSPTVAVASPEALAAALNRIARLERIVEAYLTSDQKWLPTEEALDLTGIARSTLVTAARASAPNVQEEGRITYRKDGRKCLYLKASCISYCQRRHGYNDLAA